MANPFLPRGSVFAPALKASNRRLTRAQNALPNRSNLPAKLRQGVTAPQFHALYRSSNAHDRQMLDQHAQRTASLVNAVSNQVAAQRERNLQHLISQGVSLQDAHYLTAPSRASVPPGIHLPRMSSNTGGLGALAKYPFLAAKALVLHPTHVIPATMKGFGEMAAAAPAGVVETALNALEHPHLPGTPYLDPSHPDPLRQMVDDYKRRYSGDFYQRVQREGLAPEILDAAGIAAPAGKALGFAARAGALGETAAGIATDARPALRIGGKMTRDQNLSENFFRAVAQKGQDAARAQRMTRILKDGRGGDAIVQDAANSGQLTPLGLKQSLKKQAAQPEGVLRRERSIALQQLLKPYRDKVKRLSAPERQAVKTATQYGIHTPEQAAAHLPTLIENIVANRQLLDKTPTGALAKDEVPLLQKMVDRPEHYFTPRVAAVAQTAGDIAHKSSLLDPTFKADTAVGRRYAAQGALLRLKRGQVPQIAGDVPPMVHEGETGVEFAKRVKATRAALDVPLEQPGYFPSEKYPFTNFSAFTRGSALRGVNGTRQYSGILRDIGAEHNSPSLLEQAVARNLRHAYNHDAVTKTLANQALPWSVSKDGKPWMTATQLHEKAASMGLRPDSYVVVRPGLFDKELAARAGQDTLDAHAGYAPLGDGVAHVHDALKAATSEQPGNPLSPDYARTQRAVAVPRAVFDELSAASKPSSAAARKLGAVKGVWSAAMLGTSPPWLSYQVGANTLQASLAGAKPWDYLTGRKVWADLTPTEQQQLGARIGIGNDVHHIEQLGSQGGQWAQKWNAVRQQIHDTPVLGSIVRGANIPKHMFKLDEMQNNAFRTAVLGSEVKKAAYQRLVANSRDGMTVLDKAAARMSTPDGAAKVLQDPRVVDSIAKKVNDFMGDYTSYTSTERHLLSRNVMFYGYLRYSLKFLLQTMPSQRPLVTAALAKFGQLHADEVHRLLGGDETPWSVGKIFSSDGRTEFDLSRLNPFLNAASTADALTNPSSAAVGVLPPYYQLIANQAARQNLFTGTGWKLDGSSAPSTSKAGNWRVALADALGTVAPYRIPMNLANPAPQGADSLLFAPRPTRYKRADVVSSINADVTKQKGSPLWLRLLQQAAPIPRPSKDKITAASIRAKNHRSTVSGEHAAPGSSSSSGSWQQPGAGYGGTWR